MPESPGRAQRWEVYVDGEPMGFRLDAKGAPQPDRARLTRMQAHLGMVFQQFNLWPHLSVLGLVIEAPMQVGRLSRAEPRRGANPHPFRLGLCGRPRLALGEKFCIKCRFAPYLEAGVMDYCCLDLCRAGGITEGRKVAAPCEVRYIPMIPHNSLGAVSFAANLHLGVSVPNFAYLEYKRPTNEDPRCNHEARHAEPGFPVPLDRPGIGREIDEPKLRDLCEASWRTPRLRDNDVGIVAWERRLPWLGLTPSSASCRHSRGDLGIE